MLAYTERGVHQRIKILFVHGFPLNRTMWNSQVNSLSPITHTIAVDLPGMGDTPPYNESTSSISLSTYADSIKTFMEQKGIQKAIFAGCSWGGYLAFEMWRKYPKLISGMILANTRMEPDRPQDKINRQKQIENLHTKQDLVTMADKMVSFAFRNRKGVGTKEAALVRDSITSCSIEGVKHGLQSIMNRPDSQSMLSTINVPVLIISGKYDTGITVETSENLQRHIRKSKLEIVDSGHLSSIENPEAVSQAIDKFIQDKFIRRASF